MACVFAGDEKDSRAAGLSSCLAGSWKIPLTPEKLRVFLVLDLAGHCGRSDFYRAVHFCRPAGSKKLLNAATPSLVREVFCLWDKHRSEGTNSRMLDQRQIFVPDGPVPRVSVLSLSVIAHVAVLVLIVLRHATAPQIVPTKYEMVQAVSGTDQVAYDPPPKRSRHVPAHFTTSQ